MQTSTLIRPIGLSAVRSIPLHEGQRIEVEFDADEAAIEIRHIEPNECVSGSIFVQTDDLSNLIAVLRDVARKSGGRSQ